MAEENEKKPEFVVHKKQQDATPATPEKKRVVVVKRKTNQNQNQNSQKPSEQNQKKDGDLGSILNLCRSTAKELISSRCRHSAGNTHLALTAYLGSRY